MIQLKSLKNNEDHISQNNTGIITDRQNINESVSFLGKPKNEVVMNRIDEK